MLKVPPIPFLRRRRPAQSPVAPPVAALAVVNIDIITFSDDELILMVMFDTTVAHPLNNPGVGGFSAAKWNARANDTRYDGVGVQWFDFQRLQVYMEASAPAASGNALNYSNAPSDVSDTLGRALAAFSGMPF